MKPTPGATVQVRLYGYIYTAELLEVRPKTVRARVTLGTGRVVTGKFSRTSSYTRSVDSSDPLSIGVH